jgi:hypothetical protein
MGLVVNATPRPLYPPERPGTPCIGGWVGQRPVWTGAENLASHRIRPPDRSVTQFWHAMLCGRALCQVEWARICFFSCLYDNTAVQNLK